MSDTFHELFGRPAQVRAEAPGRVNLIGEHTDYNGGFVLPLAIPQRTRVELAAREEGRVRAWSASLRGCAIEEYSLGAEEPVGGWLDYVQGVTQVLRRAGHGVRGFDLRIESDVPLGSGLSSSAALEVSLLRAMRQAFHLALDDVELALAAQQAENELVGAPVGIMDPMAVSLAGETTALFLDTRSLQYQRVPLPGEAELVVIDSGIPHHHAGGEYGIRRQECAQAAALLGVAQLCALDTHDLWRLSCLPEPLDRRARHVVTENARVRWAVAAMRERDLTRLGKLLDASHESLRNDYEVSLPEIDHLVALAHGEPAVFGARLTGGGFGGAIVALTTRGAGREVADRLVARYRDETGENGAVLVPR